MRANLQRRFTTDSSKLSSSWNYLNPGTSQLPDPLDLLSSVSLVFFFSLLYSYLHEHFKPFPGGMKEESSNRLSAPAA